MDNKTSCISEIICILLHKMCMWENVEVRVGKAAEEEAAD